MTPIRIGIVGCGWAARIHTERLRAVEGVSIVGCADAIPEAAQALAESLGDTRTFADHTALLSETKPDALAIFTPPRAHYRPAMDALQAGCHVFIEKPLSTNAQEAADMINLARGRNRIVGVGHQYRLYPALQEARARLADGEIGRPRLATALLASHWWSHHREGPENAWRLDPRIAGGGILADEADHLLDALLWLTGSAVAEVAAFQQREAPALDVVDAVALRFENGTPASLAVSGDTNARLFELTFLGDRAALRVTDSQLLLYRAHHDPNPEALPLSEPTESIDENFIAALRGERPLCCSAEESLPAVRLQEAIARSAASGQLVTLSTPNAAGASA